MTVIGYTRVSVADQALDLQVEALKAVGCTIVRSEKARGASTTDRPELASILEFIRAGDELVVTQIDRLARSINDLQHIVRTLRDRGATLRVLQQPIDTSTATGKCFLDMLGVFAEFETNLRREWRLEGVPKAKGIMRRQPLIDVARVRELKDQGLGAKAIAKRLGIARASVYRVLQSRD